MSDKPKVSIVLCTYNNADSLEITLDQIARQQGVSLSAVELIVVDNNSPDHTESIFQRVVAESPIHMRYFFESRQGLSHARNTGVEKANGEYILFTDDDAEISESWVSGYIRNIEAQAPDCLYSKIEIVWDKPKPWWFTKRYVPYFVGLDYGDSPLKITDMSKEFFGKNFCVKKNLITELGGFDPALGRSGAKLIAGEETMLYRKMINMRKEVLYFPDSAVGHRLKDSEYTEENIRKKMIDGAYSAHHIAKLNARKKIFGRPLGSLINYTIGLVFSGLGVVAYWLLGNKRERFYHAASTRRSLKTLQLWVSSNDEG